MKYSGSTLGQLFYTFAKKKKKKKITFLAGHNFGGNVTKSKLCCFRLITDITTTNLQDTCTRHTGEIQNEKLKMYVLTVPL